MSASARSTDARLASPTRSHDRSVTLDSDWHAKLAACRTLSYIYTHTHTDTQTHRQTMYTYSSNLHVLHVIAQQNIADMATYPCTLPYSPMNSRLTTTLHTDSLLAYNHTHDITHLEPGHAIAKASCQLKQRRTSLNVVLHTQTEFPQLWEVWDNVLCRRDYQQVTQGQTAAWSNAQHCKE